MKSGVIWSQFIRAVLLAVVLMALWPVGSILYAAVYPDVDEKSKNTLASIINEINDLEPEMDLNNRDTAVIIFSKFFNEGVTMISINPSEENQRSCRTRSRLCLTQEGIDRIYCESVRKNFLFESPGIIIDKADKNGFIAMKINAKKEENILVSIAVSND